MKSTRYGQLFCRRIALVKGTAKLQTRVRGRKKKKKEKKKRGFWVQISNHIAVNVINWDHMMLKEEGEKGVGVEA